MIYFKSSKITLIAMINILNDDIARLIFILGVRYAEINNVIITKKKIGISIGVKKGVERTIRKAISDTNRLDIDIEIR